jgi:hypothetical protein
VGGHPKTLIVASIVYVGTIENKSRAVTRAGIADAFVSLNVGECSGGNLMSMKNPLELVTAGNVSRVLFFAFCN